MITQEPRWIPPMSWGGTLVSFGAPAIVLYVTTRLAIPAVTQSMGLPPIAWFMTFGAFYVLADSGEKALATRDLLIALALDWKVLLTALPVLIAVPYAAHRQRSSSVGAAVHAGAWMALLVLVSL